MSWLMGIEDLRSSLTDSLQGRQERRCDKGRPINRRRHAVKERTGGGHHDPVRRRSRRRPSISRRAAMSATIAHAATQAAPAPQPDFAAIKTKQQATWASGDFAVIGTTLQIVGES